MKSSFRFLTVSLAVIILLALLAPPVLSQLAPSISVTATWGMATELTSLDTLYNPLVDPAYGPYPTWNWHETNGVPGFQQWQDEYDDYRFVDVTINGTTTVEFWAMELVCTVNANVLDSYPPDKYDTLTPGFGWDNGSLMWAGSAWQEGWDSYMEKNDIAPTVTAGLLKYQFVVSERGRSNPVGHNGVSTAVQLANLRFRVKPTAGTSPLNCTFTFLDRNGKTISGVTPVYTPPPLFTAIAGYTLTGNVSYQARTIKNGIGVGCYQQDNSGDWIGLPGSPKLTDAAGNFTFTGIRNFNHMNCTVYGNISAPDADRDPDIYLAANFNYNVGERRSFREMPIELHGGNLFFEDCDPGSDIRQCINDNDWVTLTSSWGAAQGDINGDLKTDRTDLAILAGNINLDQEEVNGDHILYSLARGWTATGRDSHIWMSGRNSGLVVQQVPTAPGTADFWAALSPDGSTIVFVRKTPVAGSKPKYELYKMSTTAGLPTLLLSKAAAGNLDAFAPSWSQDGSRIAFVCSSSYGITVPAPVPASGYAFNAGDLCVVNASGTGFMRLTGTTPVGRNTVKIFPPAWEGNWIIFGATQNVGSGCTANTLCYYDFNREDGSYIKPLDADIPGAAPAGSADMPVMVNGWLFYRFTETATGESTLRVVTWLDYDCGPGPGCDRTRLVKTYTPHPNSNPAADCPTDANPRPAFAHTNVVFNSDPDDDGLCTYEPLDWNWDIGGSHYVDYYTMRPYGYEFMFYADNDTTFVNTGYRWEMENGDTTPGAPGCADGIGTDSDRCWPEWQPIAFFSPSDIQADLHWINSQVTNDYWTGDPLVPTLLHAERATAHWNP